MHLQRIHAVRYGALEDVSLGDIGPGLTVVLGANEAGKTTLVDLVRRVLYGFPYQGKEKDSFRPASGGKRHGRLVFADGEEEWTIDRLDGTRGGEATVHCATGETVQDLLAKTTRGVSSQAFKIVFGFGLEELADIERRDSADDVLGRLYAASAGVAVSPQDVRSTIAGAAEAIFAPSARKREMNALHAEEREYRAALREAAARMESFAADRRRSTELTDHVAELDIARSLAVARADVLRREAEALQAAEQRLEEAESRATEFRRHRVRLEATLEAIAVDEAALAAGPDVDVLCAEASGFTRDLAELKRRTAEREGIASEIDALVADAGLDADALSAVRADAESRNESERRGRDVESAEIALRQAREEAVAGMPAGTAGGRGWIPVAVAAAAGALAIERGVVLDEWTLTAAGAVLALAACALWWFGPRRYRSAGVETPARPASTPRVIAAEQALAVAREDLEVWLGRIGLPADFVPAEVRRVMGIAERAAAARSRAREVDAIVGTLATAAADFARRLASVGGATSGKSPPSLDDVPTALERLRAAVVAARDADGRRRILEEEVAGIAADLVSAVDEAERARAEATAILEAYPDANGSLDGLRRLADEADRSAEAAKVAHAEACSERDRLEGKLTLVADDSATAEMRLGLAGVRERLTDATERYLVKAVAVRLLDTARARYESERQPEVVRRAEQVFRRVTGERYVRLAIPLGGEAIRVADAADAAKTSDLLSRGTAEQLYLALRLGLLETLGDVASGLPVLMDDVLVNFDPERLRGAASAIADLADTRQVVFFTCHPATVDLFGEVARPTVIAMDRC